MIVAQQRVAAATSVHVGSVARVLLCGVPLSASLARSRGAPPERGGAPLVREPLWWFSSFSLLPSLCHPLYLKQAYTLFTLYIWHRHAAWLRDMT